MTQTVKTPEFRSPEEEAQWWDANQATVEKMFTDASANGTLRRGTLAKRGNTPTTTIRLAPDDIDLAKQQAAERGLKYQTYLKMIIHRALRQEVSDEELAGGSRRRA